MDDRFYLPLQIARRHLHSQNALCMLVGHTWCEADIPDIDPETPGIARRTRRLCLYCPAQLDLIETNGTEEGMPPPLRPITSG